MRWSRAGKRQEPVAQLQRMTLPQAGSVLGRKRSRLLEPQEQANAYVIKQAATVWGKPAVPCLPPSKPRLLFTFSHRTLNECFSIHWHYRDSRDHNESGSYAASQSSLSAMRQGGKVVAGCAGNRGECSSQPCIFKIPYHSILHFLRRDFSTMV